jgi:subtilisin-like proprotein convertase family protein
MSIKRFSLGLLAICLWGSASAQMSIYDNDYDQSNPLDCGTLAAGGINFVDMGGNYLPNMDETIVFCPDLAQGSKVSIAFATNIGYEFNIDPTDTMYIFDGPSIAAPLLGAFNSATNPTGMNVQATFINNPSGCLTVRFRSDGANEGTGWIAKVACGNLAQPFYPHLEAFVNGSATNALNPIDTGYVDVCLGDSILLVAKPQFPYSLENTGTGYSQNLTNVNYSWSIGGVGTLPVNNDSVWFVPPARQGYFVDLRIQDQFPQNQRITCKIRVSQLPIFAGTGPLEDTVCLGLNTNLIGGVTPTDTVGVDVPAGTFPIGGTFAGLTFLPDGNGQLYTTTVNMTGLGSGTVTSASDIQSICLDIEHSFLGDLEIAITCPNGTMVSLANTYGGGGLFPGGCFAGGVNLGNDTDQDGGAPGTPVETYCFSWTNATLGTMCNELGNTVPNAYGSQMLNPNGVYLPDGNVNDLIGCPLEGPWTISVQDNQGIDDGYIFQWGILFDASLYPDPESYQNVITSDFWTNDPTIVTGQSDTAIVVVPTTPGPHNYTYNVTDDFGCSYDTTVVLYTLPQPTIFDDTLACNFTFNVSGTTSFAGGSWSAADTNIRFLPNANVPNPTITSSIPGTFTVTFTDSACGTAVSSQIFFQNWAWTEIFDTILCAGSEYVINASAQPQNLSYLWTPGNATGTSLTVNQPGIYYVTVENECNTWTDSAIIGNKLCDISVPNIIVLSSTQGNNAFHIQYEGVKEFECTILNRWGNVMREYTNPADAWDGKDAGGNIVEEGVYFYIIKATLESGEELEKQGFVQVLH